jgi:hypothetical protein
MHCRRHIVPPPDNESGALLIHVENVHDSQRHFTRTESNALHAVIDSAVAQRLQVVHAATRSAPMPQASAPE